MSQPRQRPEQPPVVGYTPAQLEAAAVPLEAAVVAALFAVAAAAASKLVTVPAGAPAKAAGAAYVTLDDLAAITTMWLQHTDTQLMPILRSVFHDTAEHVHGQISKMLADLAELPPGVTEIPSEVAPIPDVHAEDLLMDARNRLVGIGDLLWANAREQMAQGMREGESIPQLADRVRSAAGVSEPRATMIARTEIVSVSNGASIAQARTAGVPLEKEWMATEDSRTRLTHAEADSQRVPLDQPFIVGGFPLDVPGDPTGPPGEIINCRCSLGFHLASDIVTAAARKLEGEALAEFNRKHPRGHGGKFGSGGGSAKFKDVLSELEKFGKRPKAKDRDRLHELLSGLSAPELRKVAEHFGENHPTAKVAQQRADLIEAKKTPTAVKKTVEPAKAPRAPKAFKKPNLDRVSAKEFEKARGGITEKKEPGSGAHASAVYLVTFGDGSKAVHKTSTSSIYAKALAKAEFDAEQIAAVIGDALGLNAPAVYRTGDGEAYFDYVGDGRVAGSVPEISSSSSNMDVDGYFDTLDGRRIGLLDALIENPDRHQGNWFVHDDGSVTPIDHGLAWEAYQDNPDAYPADRATNLGGFTGHYIGAKGRTGEWLDNDLSPAYVKQVQTKLAALQPQFEELGHPDWHERMMTRLDLIAAHAKGKVTL